MTRLLRHPFAPSRWHRDPARAYFVVTCLFSALVLLGAWAAVAAMLHWQWNETLHAEKRQNTNTATALKSHTLSILDTVDQAMSRLEHTAKDGPVEGGDLIAIANETGMAPHILKQLSLVDAQGRFQGSNLDPDGSRSQHVNLMDREHIRVHLAPGTTDASSSTGMLHNGLFISKVIVGKVSGTSSIQLSRKVVGSDGKPLGVVVASLNPAHFADVYRQVDLGSQGGVALAGLDGTLRVRVRGGAPLEIVNPLPGTLLQTVRDQERGSLLATSADGVSHIIGFSRVGNYPLVMLSGTSEEQAFARWRATRNTVFWLTGLLSVAVIGFVAVFLGSIRRLAASHTALKRSEAEAQRANQAKSDFLSMMSHELRTPLTSIRGFAELMELRGKDPQTREQASYIRHGAEHLNALLTEILDLARIEAGAMPAHFDPVDLQCLVRDVVELFRVGAEAKSLALDASSAEDVPQRLVTDPLKLKQILNNLLSNAIKFTPAGSVRLRVEMSPDGQAVRFQVTDSGPGVPAHLHDTIFEKFRQGQARGSEEHGGTGLGLSLSRALAELLGGTLTMQSRSGEGATFTLSLPVEAQHTRTADSP